MWFDWNLLYFPFRSWTILVFFCLHWVILRIFGWSGMMTTSIMISPLYFCVWVFLLFFQSCGDYRFKSLIFESRYLIAYYDELVRNCFSGLILVVWRTGFGYKYGTALGRIFFIGCPFWFKGFCGFRLMRKS